MAATRSQSAIGLPSAAQPCEADLAKDELDLVQLTALARLQCLTARVSEIDTPGAGAGSGGRQPAAPRAETTLPHPGGTSEPRTSEEFLPFYEREYRGLVALSASLIGDRAMAEDIAQDALLAAYARWDQVAVLESPIGWTRRVVINKSVSLIRRRVAELRAVVRLGSRAQTESAYESDADFWRLVRSLPRRQAQVVALHYVSDLTVADIAATLGCQEGSVKASLFKARKNLMRRLDPGGGPQISDGE